MGFQLSIVRDAKQTAGDLIDSLRNEHVPELVEINCDMCNSKRGRQRTLTITQAPEILVIQLARLQGEVFDGVYEEYRASDAVRYPEDLDLSQFNTAGKPLEYRLYGVVGHAGSKSGGHYIAAVRHSDDAGFSTISDHDVTQSHGGTVQELLDLKYTYGGSKKTKFPWTSLLYIKQ
ncbi:hypothetical protein LTR36_000442 [Oleoguttula mirabilis]|uniref:USP domain-containing protein n=1 Tax=Oleoguttula mirabilis TaxID=1507867 RepID=A0AAV9K087_9PEZI|nr:hypothetical protein LTR36_000442 [Oleoguttula mirabilis]